MSRAESPAVAERRRRRLRRVGHKRGVNNGPGCPIFHSSLPASARMVDETYADRGPLDPSRKRAVRAPRMFVREARCRIRTPCPSSCPFTSGNPRSGRRRGRRRNRKLEDRPFVESEANTRDVANNTPSTRVGQKKVGARGGRATSSAHVPTLWARVRSGEAGSGVRGDLPVECAGGCSVRAVRHSCPSCPGSPAPAIPCSWDVGADVWILRHVRASRASQEPAGYDSRIMGVANPMLEKWHRERRCP